MFDRLIDILAGLWESLLPWKTIYQFEEGVVLTFGRYRGRKLGPGLHFVVPFIDTVLTEAVVPRAGGLDAQTLTTADGQTVTIQVMLTWMIRREEIDKALLEVEHVEAAVRDIFYGAVGEAVSKNNLEDLNNRSFLTKLKNTCQARADEYGIQVIRIAVTQLAQSFTLRMIQD